MKAFYNDKNSLKMNKEKNNKRAIILYAMCNIERTAKWKL